MSPKTKMASKSRKASALFASNNFQVDFSGKLFEGTDIKMMAAALRKSSHNVYFHCASTHTPNRYISHAYPYKIPKPLQNTGLYLFSVVTTAFLHLNFHLSTSPLHPMKTYLLF